MKHCLIPLTAAALISTQAYSATVIWNNYHGNAAHTAYNEITTNPDKFKLAWETMYMAQGPAGSADYKLSPIITDNTIFYTVRPYRQVPINNEKPETEQAIFANNLATQFDDWGNDWVIDDNDLNYPATIPVADNDKIYWITSTENNASLLTFDFNSGHLISNNKINTLNNNSRPNDIVVFDHQLYVGDASGNEYALNPENGSVKWAVSATNQQQPGLGATVTDNYVILGDYPDLAVINRQTGEKVTINIDAKNTNHFVNLPVWDEKNKCVYMVIDSDKNASELIAVDVDQRKVKWRLAIPGNAAGTIVLAHDIIYISNYTQLFEVNAVAGSINWNTSIYYSSEMDMVATADRVFISTHDGNVQYVYSVSRLTHEVGDLLVNSGSSKLGYLSLDNNRLYVITRDDMGEDVSAFNLN